MTSPLERAARGEVGDSFAPGWAWRAVEDEAMRRARAEAALHPGTLFAGLTAAQILWLRADYMKRTGQGAETIPGAAPTPGEPNG